MGRRIFEKQNCIVEGSVLSIEQFRLFSDLEQGFQIPDFRRAELIAKAETAQATPIPQLTSREYMLFTRTGNRSIFEDRYFLRRTLLLDLAIGEWVERQGRFSDKLLEVLWAILEESTWVIPAHNRQRPSGVHASLPLTHVANYIDLFSAATGAAVAVAYYLHRELVDNAPADLKERLGYELERQLLTPYLDDQTMTQNCKWSGLSGGKVNNWCPWIVTNLLTVCALFVEDGQKRTRIVARSLPLLDNFAAACPDDGGCDEGPRYWELAGGSLWAACVLLRDLTGGRLDMLNEPLLKALGEYEVKMIASRQRLLTIADAPADYMPNGYLLYHWGQTCQSPVLSQCAGWLGRQPMLTERRTPYKYLRYLTTPQLSADQVQTRAFDYLQSLQIAISRPSGRMGEGLYLAIKGGHNGESHNHNDLGSITVYSGQQPLFIDMGAGEYTKRYFGPERYEVWLTRSDFHNCATFNGICQSAGREAAASQVVYDAMTGALGMNLESAYPGAGLAAYRRTAVAQKERILLTDQVRFAQPGTVCFHFMTTCPPELLGAGCFRLGDRTVCFDPGLTMTVDEPDLSIPEAEPLRQLWNVEDFYRITLRSNGKIKEHTFVLEVR